MSNTKTVMSQAANTLTAPLNVEDVFSTYLYESSNSVSPKTITNNIDLSGEGGMVWIKSRNDTSGNGWPHITDTERGVNKRLITSSTAASNDSASFQVVDQFNSDGFRYADGNGSTYDYASWTFRKAPKFFDVVTYTGTNVIRTVSHNLGSVPGMIIVKRTDTTGAWRVYHRGSDATAPENYYLTLNATDQAGTGGGVIWNDTAPTDSVFTVGANNSVNASGGTYVAYLFAHNDGDGGFNGGDIIKCGSYTGNQNAVGPVIDLGFEPQWLLIKNASASRPWLIIDVMRGTVVGTTNAGADNYLEANTSAAEQVDYYLSINSTGFQPRDTGGNINASGETYIYMAIRRGTKVPESATEVFALQQDDAGDGNAPAFRSDFPVDAAFSKNAAAVSVNFFGSRLQGANYLRTSETNAEAANADFQWDYMNGWNSEPAQGSSVISYMWKRAPGYFDVIAYTGDSTAGRTVSHNLGVAPEMMWVKRRDATSGEGWFAYHKDLTSAAYYLNVNSTAAESQYWNAWNSTAPTSSVFSLGNYSDVNLSGGTYIAYLFASLPGISKVGSYTGTGAAFNVDCGFTSGARFVLLKKTSGTGNWYVFDTERGIVAGNDPYLYLNLTNAEVNSRDGVDPLSSGFALTSDATFNASGATYIFYAIA